MNKIENFFLLNKDMLFKIEYKNNNNIYYYHRFNISIRKIIDPKILEENSSFSTLSEMLNK